MVFGMDIEFFFFFLGRRYLSMHHPDLEAQYTCTILRGEDYDGGSGPRCVVFSPFAGSARVTKDMCII